MADIPRLNGVIRALEAGKPAFTSFWQADPETAIAMSAAKYDGIVYEMEHNPWDIRALRDCLQYMLNRCQIAKSSSLAPSVTPMVRIPPNGAEKAQFQAKQALDLGAYGIVWPHISSVDEAYNAVAACRYPRLKSAPMYEPAGIRGDGPTAAVRYWGLSQQDYYARADVWPLNPKGEVFVILMMEDTRGIEALPDIIKKVPGIGAILIGEGDLSQELGYPRQGLPLSHGCAGAQLRRLGQGAQARRTGVKTRSSPSRRSKTPFIPAHSASLRAFTPVFDGLWTRVNALM